ncbi:MAG: phosphoribosylamine--glycine ligase [Deltaproteobacteria bacterium]|nr:phosphoribosylamine--glycine ligase [Deltaproteobacteria bacterium]
MPIEKKRVLVVGSGGREHALCWKLAMSPRIAALYCAPGNAGIAQCAVCVPLKATDLNGILEFVRKEQIDITVIGPEAPLAEGLADLLEANGFRVFGPSKQAAQMEASKTFAKEIMAKAGVPTAAHRVFTEQGSAMEYIREVWAKGHASMRMVLKADGLAAGKGVIVAGTLADAEEAVRDILERRVFGEAGNSLIVEEFLQGEEASFMAVTDGETVLPLATSQDHKAVFDGDQGPNTGGMGAYSPAPVVSDSLFNEVMETIMKPVVKTLAAKGILYKGVLYAGLMIQDGRPKVLEFNCRFGDPEAQPILMRLETDLMEIMEATLDGRLKELHLKWDSRAAVCVVMASEGYPGKYETGKKIKGLDKAAKMPDVQVFHAGTAMKDGKYVTAGGRVLGVTALGDTISAAIETAYHACSKIYWDGVHYRKDIGQKALKHLNPAAMPASVPVVGIVMGSKSDMEVMEEARNVLKEFGVSCEMRILSAHRTPELAMKYAKTACERGLKIIIAGAGMAAHLAGAMAAHTTLPIIGVPMANSSLGGLDALLSTVQMPPGVPVACMAIGKAGAKNAAMFAVQILAVSDPVLADRLQLYRKRQLEQVLKQNEAIEGN